MLVPAADAGGSTSTTGPRPLPKRPRSGNTCEGWRQPSQVFPDRGLFGSGLGPVVEVLPPASAAGTNMRTTRRDPVGGGLFNADQLGFRVRAGQPDQAGTDDVSGG